jgi:hypothetical protein
MRWGARGIGSRPQADTGSDYSITSSAASSSDCGNVGLIACAIHIDFNRLQDRKIGGLHTPENACALAGNGRC